MFSVQRRFIALDEEFLLSAEDTTAGERRLWAAVLWRAFYDYEQYQVERNLSFFADAQLAKMWIDDKTYYQYSFEWTCDTAYKEISDAVRDRIRYLVRAPLTDEYGKEVCLRSELRGYPKRDLLSKEILIAKQQQWINGANTRKTSVSDTVSSNASTEDLSVSA